MRKRSGAPRVVVVMLIVEVGGGRAPSWRLKQALRGMDVVDGTVNVEVGSACPSAGLSHGPAKAGLPRGQKLILRRLGIREILPFVVKSRDPQA